MKRVFIVHRWGGSPNEAIHAWLKKELADDGFKVFALQMPNSDNPQIEPWVKFLAKKVGKCDSDTYFFGHSIGCQTIMRYLENLKNQKAGGAVFLSGWFDLDNMETDEEKHIAGSWIDTPIDFKKVRAACSHFEVIISEDEPYGYVKENTKKFKKELGAKVTLEDGYGHYTEEDGVREIPQVLETLTRMMGLGEA